MLIEGKGNSIIEVNCSHLETGLDLSLEKGSKIALPGLHKKTQPWGGPPPVAHLCRCREALLL